MDIATLRRIVRRELAQRVSGGLEITLYWSPLDDSTSIDIHQEATEETISFEVPREHALHAFHHPFAHLGEEHGAPVGAAA